MLAVTIPLLAALSRFVTGKPGALTFARMSVSLTLSGELSVHTAAPVIDPLVADGHAIARAGDITLDLTNVTFVTPSSMVTLAAIIESRCRCFAPIQLAVPKNGDCRRYLAAAGFVQAVCNFVPIVGGDDLIGREPANRTEAVLPLTRIAKSDEMPSVLRDLEERIDAMLGRGDASWDSAKRGIVSTLRELGENVFQHAGGAPGWIAGQRYRNRSSGKEYVEIAIADAGRGVRRSLATRYTELLTATDGEALERALREGLSSSAIPERGTGYFVLQHWTKQSDGSFYLRSGTGAVTRPRRRPLHRVDGLGAWPGTQLQFRLTCA